MRLLIAALAALVLAAPANAAEIHVNMKDDLLDPLDGECSLREAIASANANMGMTGCAVGDPTATDTIVLPVSTFILTRAGANEDDDVDGDLDVRAGGPLVIEGNGATITAAGSGTITNSLFSGNATGAGGDGGDAVAGPGGLGGNGGDGGALAAMAGVAIAHSTFIGGATGSGGHAGNGTLPGQDGGPGLATALRGGASTTVARSIIAGSCFVALTDGGQNLGSGSCPGSAAAPNLDADGAPRAGSQAIDGAATAGCPTPTCSARRARRACAATSARSRRAPPRSRSAAPRSPSPR
jgi:hypothetical protein